MNLVAGNSLHTDERSALKLGGELKGQFKESNGLWEAVEAGSATARQIVYKLRMAMGMSWNPKVLKMHRIQPPQRMPQ
jgi:hypothetical protein